MHPERRWDECTAKSIDDALRAQGTLARAQALAHQNIRPDLARRVLTAPGKRRASCAR